MNDSQQKISSTLLEKLEKDKKLIQEHENQSRQSIDNVRKQLESSLITLSQSVQRTTKDAIQQQSEALNELLKAQQVTIQKQINANSWRTLLTLKTPLIVLLVGLLALNLALWMWLIPASKTVQGSDGTKWQILTAPDWAECPVAAQVKAPCRQLN